MPLVVDFSTLPEMFVRVTDHFAPRERVAVAQKNRNGVVELTHSMLRRRVDHFACGLATLGVKRGDRVGIIAENRPEWVVADHAVLSLGAADVPVFPTLTAEQVRWIFDNAGAEVAIVSNDFQLRKILSVADNIPSLRHIIVMAVDTLPPDPRVLPFVEILTRGEEYHREHPTFLRDQREGTKPGDLVTIIYTSGTTGTPKGVMLTHNNLVSNIKGAIQALPRIDENDVILSYLPLCHSFERIASYFMFACGVRGELAESIDKVAENLRQVRPTIVTTVPRLLERMHGKIIKKIETGPERSRKIFLWAVETGKAYHRARRKGSVGPLLTIRFALANKLVFEKLHEIIGGRLRFFVAGGAALSKELGEFFEAIGIIVIEGYGLTESSPVISVNRFGRHVFGTVGQPIPDVHVRIAGDGEILVQGPNVMQGYWKNDEATREAIDIEGWLHTGDVGEIDGDGNIRITDRKKHLFVSSGGKNIAPQAIENDVLQSMYIDQVFLIGDKRQFITALIVPDFEALRSFAAQKYITTSDVPSLIAHPEILALFQSELDRVQTHLANYERIRRWTLLPTAFTVESGELTPTQKIKRKVVEERYAEMIEKMYVV